MQDNFEVIEVGAYEQAIHSGRWRRLDDGADDNHGHAVVQQQQIVVDCSDDISNKSATIELISVPRTLKCPQCRRYFATAAEVEAHTLVRHSAELNERFKCADCLQSFSSQGSLYKHQKIHTGERPFVCHTCDKSFNQLANLQRHYMVHTGEKPFACKTCHKQFSQQSNVDKHQVTHSKIKPFACNICDKQFTQRANLQKHERVHTGERPYQCPICHKRYAQMANMNKHMQLHKKANETLAYQCGKCKKLYDTLPLYDAHLKDCDALRPDYNFEMLNADGAAEPLPNAATLAEEDADNVLVLNVVKTELGDHAEEVDDLNELLQQTNAYLAGSATVDDGCGGVVVDPLMVMHDVEYLIEADIVNRQV